MLTWLRWLASAVIGFGVLICFGVVAMEAAGLIFLPDPVDNADRRAEAAMARIEASVDPRELPSEGEAQGLWPPPTGKLQAKSGDADAKAEGREPAKDGAKVAVAGPLPPAVDLPDGPSAGATAGAWTLRVGAESEPEAEPEAVVPIPPAPKLVATGKTTDPADVTPQATGRTKACTGACSAGTTHPPKRARPSRTRCVVDCIGPLTGWIGPIYR